MSLRLLGHLPKRDRSFDASRLDPDDANSTYPVPVSLALVSWAEARLTALRDIEWWFTFFALVERGQYPWSDKPQLFLGESYLREAIKQVVANAGHRDVMLYPFERIAARFDRGHRYLSGLATCQGRLHLTSRCPRTTLKQCSH